MKSSLASGRRGILWRFLNPRRAIALFALAASGCYSFGPWSSMDPTTRYSSTRPVEVGTEVGLRAEQSGDRIIVGAQEATQCRTGEFGHQVTAQTRTGKASVLAHLSFIPVVAGIAAGSFYLTSQMDSDWKYVLLGAGVLHAVILLAYFVGLPMKYPVINPWFMPVYSTQSRDLAGAPVSRWKDERHACRHLPPRPAPRTAVRVAATGSGYAAQWDNTTGADGKVSFDIVPPIATLAGYCGTPRVQALQVSPGAPANDDGTPDRPATPRRAAAPVPITVTAQSRPPLATIADPVIARFAGQCDSDRRSRCIAGLDPMRVRVLNSFCAEGCASMVGVMACQSAWNDCKGLSKGDADSALCRDGFRGCVKRFGVEPDALTGCADRCTAHKVEEACP